MQDVVLLNVGNTHTEAAVACGTEIGRVERLPTGTFRAAPEACRPLADCPGLPCLAACVVPDVAQASCRAFPGRDIRFLVASMVRRPDFSTVDTSTLGADRIANAVAAVRLAEPPLIVLDCGTAITTEAIDPGCRFRGGSIAPGRGLLRRALHEHTGQLPAIPMAACAPGAIGRDTVGAIRAGVDLGVLGLVGYIIGREREELGAPDCPVLATGGDAAYFCLHLHGLTRTPTDFTLRGLAEVAAAVFA